MYISLQKLIFLKEKFNFCQTKSQKISSSLRSQKKFPPPAEKVDGSAQSAQFQEDIYSPDYIISSVIFHNKSNQLLIVGNSKQHPNEIFLKDILEDNLVKITTSNA